MEPQDSSTGDITRLLRGWSAGEALAFEQLLPLVYEELHRMALRHLTHERCNVTLQATGLVNEICIRMLGSSAVPWQNRAHFFGVSAQMMRHTLIDVARRRRAERRGGPNARRVSLDDCELTVEPADADLLAIDSALERLAALDQRKASVVELRFFGGLSMEETAKTLDISLRTAHNDWEFARAWLYRELAGEHEK